MARSDPVTGTASENDAEKLSRCTIQGTTTIDSRITTLKKCPIPYQKYGASFNGFSWNDEVKCIIDKKELFDIWVKVDN
uniref:Retrotransposon protein n=1 Tax=Cucumis melo TaxID=3656 RepID=A0A9I9DWP6_CUCME